MWWCLDGIWGLSLSLLTVFLVFILLCACVNRPFHAAHVFYVATLSRSMLIVPITMHVPHCVEIVFAAFIENLFLCVWIVFHVSSRRARTGLGDFLGSDDTFDGCDGDDALR